SLSIRVSWYFSLSGRKRSSPFLKSVPLSFSTVRATSLPLKRQPQLEPSLKKPPFLVLAWPFQPPMNSWNGVSASLGSSASAFFFLPASARGSRAHIDSSNAAAIHWRMGETSRYLGPSPKRERGMTSTPRSRFGLGRGGPVATVPFTVPRRHGKSSR